jgi:hypothetical protein
VRVLCAPRRAAAFAAPATFVLYHDILAAYTRLKATPRYFWFPETPSMSDMRRSRPACGRRRAAVAAGLALALAAAGGLSACGSTFGGMPLIGEPEETPPAPAHRAAFPNVLESGSTRTTKPMTAEERAKLEADLVAARTNAAQEMRQRINQDGAQ